MKTISISDEAYEKLNLFANSTETTDRAVVETLIDSLSYVKIDDKKIQFQPPTTVSESQVKVGLESYGWKIISGQNLHGYYPDIIIKGTCLIVEVDGKYHNGKQQKIKDATRTNHLNKKGYQVLRVTNKEAKIASLVNSKVEATLGHLYPNVRNGSNLPKILKVVSKIA